MWTLWLSRSAWMNGCDGGDRAVSVRGKRHGPVSARSDSDSVPAVVNIVQAHGLVLKPTEIQGELVTPTGAAVVAATRTSDRLPERFTIRKIGLGAGKRQYERPSILRAMLIEDASAAGDEICKLESNIDDCTGEMPWLSDGAPVRGGSQRRSLYAPFS